MESNLSSQSSLLDQQEFAGRGLAVGLQPTEVGAGGHAIGVEVDAVQAGWSLLIVEKGLHQTTFQVVDVQCDKAGPRQVEADRGRGVEGIRIGRQLESFGQITCVHGGTHALDSTDLVAGRVIGWPAR